MIDLTPLDVRNKRGDFKKLMRGYDPQEVDVFLELAAERLEGLVRENIQLRERTQTLHDQVTAQTDREQAVQDALVTAQELRADIRAQSQREADHILKEADTESRRLIAEAEAEARQMIAEAEAEVRSRLRGIERQLDHAGDAIQDMERRRVRFLAEFRGLLERELDVVEVEEGRAPFEDRAIDLELGSGRAGSRATRRARTPDAEEPPVPRRTDGGATEPPRMAPAPEPRSEAKVERAAEPERAADPEPGTDPGTGSDTASGTDTASATATDTGSATGTGSAAEAGPTAETRPAAGSEPQDRGAVGRGSQPRDEVPPVRATPPTASDGPSEPPKREPARPTAPPPAVDDEPSALELELMAGAEGGRGGDLAPDRFRGVPDLETVLAEAGIEEVSPPPADEISPPPAPRRPEDSLVLFDPDDDDDDQR